MKIFASTHPFFESGLINGRVLANAGFMTALLTLDPFEEYHFFVAQPDALKAEWAVRGHLPGLARGAAKVFPRTRLPEALRKSLREHPYHVLHLSDPIHDFAHVQALRNQVAPHIPVTSVNHSISYLDYASRFLALLWEGVSVRDVMGANSQAAAEGLRGFLQHMREAYALPHEGPHIQVIPMGVDTSLFPAPAHTARADMRARLGLPPDSVLALLFGRIAVYDKMDPQPLLLAVRRARDMEPKADIHLVISGYCATGDQTPDFLHTLARMLHVPVTVLPNPSDADKAALFAAADIFVSPSDNIQETFGLTLLEAASAHLPVIAADWNGYRDIVQHGETGVLVPTLAPDHTPGLDTAALMYGDSGHHYARGQRTAVSVPELAQALTMLARDPHLRARMGAAGFARLHARFTWDAVVAQWLDRWEECRRIPLTSREESRLRTAQHPLHMPFGQVFAHYATGSLNPSTYVRESALGQSLRQGKLPWQAAGPAPESVDTNTAHRALVFARAGIRMADLQQRLELDTESLHALVLWLLKHDMLEIA